MENKNLTIYEKVKTVPEEAKRQITGGRLKGMTDIKPMWRIEKLTEIFGPAGLGWYTKTINKEIINGANNEKIAVVDIELYVNYKQPLGLEEDLWSKAIEGSGGSIFIANEKNGLYTSDECFKMAYTDALSVACKALGMGADVYWGDSKYQTNNQENEQKQTTKKVIKNTEEIDYHKLLQAKLKEMNINIPDFAKRHKLSMATPQEEVKELLKKLTKGEIS